MADKPISNHLTAGATLMLAALGRACIVTRPKATYMLETTDELEDKLLSALEITQYHQERVTINGLGVYNLHGLKHCCIAPLKMISFYFVVNSR